jgi:transposase-like protein
MNKINNNMKRNYLKMAFVCLFTVVAICSCKKDDDNDKTDDDNSSTPDNILTVVVENGSSYNELIDVVKLEAKNKSTDKYETLASAEYKNRGFVLTLPETLNSKYMSIYEYPDGITVSNSNVKIARVDLSAYKSDSHIGYFDHRSGAWEGFLVYADDDVSITGTKISGADTDTPWTSKYSVNLKKGWNIQYYMETTSENYSDHTTTEPAGAKWHFHLYDNDNDDDDDDENSIPNILTVVVENGNSYNELIDVVKLEIRDNSPEERHTLASAEYKNGGFALTLPDSVNSQDLKSYDDYPASVTISNRNVKTGKPDLSAYKSDSHTGYFEHKSGDWEGSLVYADGDVSVNGTKTEESTTYTYTSKYSMNLKKGWNIVYSKETESGTTYITYIYEATTTEPAGAKWYFETYSGKSFVYGALAKKPLLSGKQK